MTSTKLKPPLYAMLYMMMVPRAKEMGYALALHGSMARDMDLIAIPWTEEAIEAELLIKLLMEEFRLINLDVVEVDKDNQATKFKPPAKKPHGRLGWSLGWDGDMYVDISVMPLKKEPSHEM